MGTNSVSALAKIHFAPITGSISSSIVFAIRFLTTSNKDQQTSLTLQTATLSSCDDNKTPNLPEPTQ